jgi:hypothetical protein
MLAKNCVVGAVFAAGASYVARSMWYCAASILVTQLFCSPTRSVHCAELLLSYLALEGSEDDGVKCQW